MHFLDFIYYYNVYRMCISRSRSLVSVIKRAKANENVQFVVSVCVLCVRALFSLASQSKARVVCANVSMCAVNL